MSSPLLSVTMPTRNRPELFGRALRSVLAATAAVADEVEVTISDGSDDESTREVASSLLRDWPGRHTYVRNRPALDLVGNMNRAISLATGEWVHQLHDDDYLLTGAGPVICDALRSAGPEDRVFLFRVDVVDRHGRRRWCRPARRPAGVAAPPEALRRLMRNSSFVRQPSVVVRRRDLESAGLFDRSAGGPADFAMWVTLFSRHGYHAMPHAIAAYTVHDGAFTSSMWTPQTIGVICRIFGRAVDSGVVPEREIRAWETDFLHQFILAGAYRCLRAGNRAGARSALALFDLPEVRQLGPSWRWQTVRRAALLVLGRATTAAEGEDMTALSNR